LIFRTVQEFEDAVPAFGIRFEIERLVPAVLLVDVDADDVATVLLTEE
jgi:hypothetical protein